MEIRNPGQLLKEENFSLKTTPMETYAKKAGQLKQCYASPMPIETEELLAYEVASQCTQKENPQIGSMQFGVTYLKPYTVNGEFSMTRGHFHLDTRYDEYYQGLSGQGFLLMWDGASEVFAEPIFPGSVHYINGKYAHRLINTSLTEELKVAAIWNVKSGHNYASIDESGFPIRCFLSDGKVEWRTK